MSNGPDRGLVRSGRARLPGPQPLGGQGARGGIAAKLRLRSAQDKRAGQEGKKAQRSVRRITGELAGPAEHAVSDAERLLANARRALRRAGQGS